MTKSSAPKAESSPLAELDPRRYHLCLIGPLLLGLSLGLQAMITAFMLWGRASGEKFAGQLTDYAKTITFPEHDLQIFVIGLLFTLFAGLVAVGWWKNNLRQIPAEQRAEFLIRSALLQGGLAVASMIGFVWLLNSYWFSYNFIVSHNVRQAAGWLDDIRLIVPSIMALICVSVAPKFGCQPAVESVARVETRRRLINKVLLFAIPVLIVLVVGVAPGQWTNVAGQYLKFDRCHHVNFFVMGPAIAFTHGRAFGTEIYSQYGIGWPLLLSKLSNASMGSYGTFVGVEVVGGCLYYLALFFLLRLWLKREVWAAIGVVLAVYWQIFSGVDNAGLIWLTPSSTMMRHPMDVFFFLALLLHQQSGRKLWVVLAGLASALGIFLETETGVYLLVTFAVYSVMEAVHTKGWGNGVASLCAFFVAMLALLLPLLFYASRGTLFTRAFFQGWLESLIKYGSWGVGAIPVAALPDAPLVFFMAMVALYVAVIGYGVVRSFHGDAGGDEILLATISAYGLALLLLFVGRSHPYNLCHAATPFALVFTVLLFRGWSALERQLPGSWLAGVFCGGLVLLLLTNAHFLFYPSLLKSFFGDTPRAGLSLMSNPADISGLPLEAETFVDNFRKTALAIRSIAADGRNVAILDVDDTLLYYAANAAPWSRYASLFPMILTKQSLVDVERRLVEQPPTCVVIRGEHSLRPPKFESVWLSLSQVVKSHYTLYQTNGEYEVWK